MEDDTFDEVYRTYHRLIYRIVREKTEDPELAHDICQQVFLRYHQCREHVDPGFEKAWLTRTAGHLVIDYFRKKKELLMEIEEIASKGKADPNSDIAQKMADRELLERILQELWKKNSNWYEALMNVCVLGIPEKEAAENLGIHIEILRSRIYRARCHLRLLFGEEYENRT